MRIILSVVEESLPTTAARQAELHEAVSRRLADHDVRYTSGRRSLVAALVRLEGPESVAELQQRLDVPQSSLYRSLMVLDEAGILEKHHDADGVARFELAEWLTGHHHHLVCVVCGVVEDISLDPEAEAMIDELAAVVADRAGYEETGHKIEVEGVCRQCQ